METAKITSINSLIEINNDRSEGYKTATEETKDGDLKTLFTKYSTQSAGFASELKKYINSEDAKTDETTNRGKLFRVWMDLKAAITGKDRKGILSSCEFGEDAAKKVYDEVLANTEGIPPAALDIIRHQKNELQKEHDHVKSLRDSSK